MKAMVGPITLGCSRCGAACPSRTKGLLEGDVFKAIRQGTDKVDINLRRLCRDGLSIRVTAWSRAQWAGLGEYSTRSRRGEWEAAWQLKGCREPT